MNYRVKVARSEEAMAMNAFAQPLMGLMSNASLRFVVPVYQRPYSWGKEHCEQLWDDVVSVGKRPEDRHFTGSVVWVQDGVMSARGVASALLIDGQQRVTTTTLLLIALAEYAKENPDKPLSFSFKKIINKGYLIDEEVSGDDRYKLLLSQGDRETLKSLIERLLNPHVKITEDSERIMENLDFFRSRINAMEDPSVVWDGLQRLDVVSISLDAGKDNPQLIFESMNSTGKDLSSADLIRNYVLMGLPSKDQEDLYLNHWRAIEETLGANSYDEVFDEFIRNYLTVLYAPEPLAKRDVYPIFKRHVVENGYAKDSRMRDLLLELEAFARYYSAITRGTEKEPKLKAAFANLAKLESSVLNPLLMSFYQDYENQALGLDDFIDMLSLMESYVFRRAVCDAPSNALNKFLPSVIAKLNKVQEDGGNYREAFESLLMLEAGSARRFPTDAEFSQALATRDAYHFRKAFYLLTTLENAHHPKDPRNFSTGSFTIEHVMPQNALAHEEWRAFLGDDPEDIFDSLVHNIGNLTITAYNSELSDGTFDEKKERCVGGLDKEILVISNPIKNADAWGPAEIADRAEWLSQTAKVRWPFPTVDAETAKQYAVEKTAAPKGMSKTAFRRMVNEGVIAPGSKLVPASDKFDTVATVTEAGTITLPNGEEFKSPSLAAIRVASLAGGSGARNGWYFWKLGENGPLINDLRTQYFEEATETYSNTKAFRISFWEGFYEHCAEAPGFADVFGDPSDRKENPDAWATFGVGCSDIWINALLWYRDEAVGAGLYFKDKETYLKALERKSEAEAALALLNGEVSWDEIEENKKSRAITVRRPCGLKEDDLNAAYSWMTKSMLILRNIASESL